LIGSFWLPPFGMFKLFFHLSYSQAVPFLIHDLSSWFSKSNTKGPTSEAHELLTLQGHLSSIQLNYSKRFCKSRPVSLSESLIR
jgi:hypothetical protein